MSATKNVMMTIAIEPPTTQEVTTKKDKGSAQ